MHEQHKETLSALFDGEADELEMRRLLSGLDAETCAQWRRYQLLRDAAQNKLGDCDLQISIVDKVAAQIALEPDIRPSVAQVAVLVKKDSWIKPLLGFATAASVAFITVLGVQQFNQPAGQLDAGFVANGNVSASQLPMSGGLGLNTVSGSVQTSGLQYEIEAIEAQKQHDAERLRYYMQQHAQHASFNNGRGLLPQ